MYGKVMLWFVFDVISSDFEWIFDFFVKLLRFFMVYFGEVWRQRLEKKFWMFIIEDFWIIFYDFVKMKISVFSFYERFKDLKIVFFKGDLNYRKFFGDLDWNLIILFEVILRGFYFVFLCVLRICKVDLIVGLVVGQKETVEKQDKNWMLNGNWVVIFFCGKFN